MTLEGTYAGTLDRITEGIAVLLVEVDGETSPERTAERRRRLRERFEALSERLDGAEEDG